MTRYTHKHSLTLVALMVGATLTALVAFGKVDFSRSVAAVADHGESDRGTTSHHPQQNIPPDLLAAVKKARYGTALPNILSTLITPEIKLIPSNNAVDDGYGYAVAISGDTAVVSAYLDDTPGASDAGSVYIFVRSSATWVLQQKLIASDIADDAFGYAVAISGDTIVIGSRNFQASTITDAGAAYVFVRNSGVWTQQQKLIATGVVPSDFFGHAVAISGDTIVVSAYKQFTNIGQEAGAAYVFVRSGSNWTLQQKLIATDGSTQFDSFGFSVAISGNTLVVGTMRDDTGGGTDTGSAYVFVRSGATWAVQQKITASNGSASDHFGWSVAVSGDTLVVGSPDKDTPAGADAGTTYVYVRSGAIWSEQAKLTASDGGGGDFLGNQVAVSGDTIIAGAPNHDTAAGTDAGSVYVFVRVRTEWIELRKLTASDGAARDHFGWVAINDDTAVIGAPASGPFRSSDPPGNTRTGSAYVFTIEPDTTPPTLTVPSTITTEATSPTGAVVTYSVSAKDDRDPNPQIDCDHQSGDTFPIGTTLVTCTATDAFKNSASDEFTINVVDPTPTPTPTPNPCLATPTPPENNFRKAIALGAAPAVRVSDIGGPQDLLYKYRTTDSPCASDLAELRAESDRDTARKGDPNIVLIKESGTTWVRLWVDWAAIQPYSWVKLPELQSRSLEELRALEADKGSAPELRRAARLLINLDGQIRVAHKEKLQVILTVNHSYPLWTNDSRVQVKALPGQSDEYGPILGCDNACQGWNDVEFILKSRTPRDSFRKVPTNLNARGPWADWIGFLIERYGLTQNKINPNRQPCSYNFNGEGCGDYQRYVDFLEIVNEPNLTHWPQRNANDNLIMPLYVARMFRAAKGELDRRNRIVAGQLPPGSRTTLRLLGPALSDSTETNDRRTSYYEFTRELFKRLDSINFRAGDNFAWSHHNYGDVEYGRYGQTRTVRVDPDDCDTNSAAWLRRLLRVGAAGYRWEGWPDLDHPKLLITEGGARLSRLISLYNIAPTNLRDLQSLQAGLVKANFLKMDLGSLSPGIAMTTNYLTYSDPRYDTGLMDFLFNPTPNDQTPGCEVWKMRAACDAPGSGRPTKIPCRDAIRVVPPCACTGADGKEREVYRIWKTLVPSR